MCELRSDAANAGAAASVLSQAGTDFATLRTRIQNQLIFQTLVQASSHHPLRAVAS